ncbi:MAG TPA: nicotinate (nicotinamide) nucleotide adenylyltransferase [Firmicutes bacterium]|nr:nicotinate (nicotinamide) nucleotide adenylyltransferase [Bacillota bacterium]
MERSANRIGILGGTFNPVHFGHLVLAQEAWYRFELARVLFVPAAQNPLREDDPRDEVSDAHRLAMLKLGCGRDSRFAVDAHDLRRGGQSYMIDTLRRLGRVHAGSGLVLILGEDAAVMLDRWRYAAEFHEYCELAVAYRPGGDEDEEQLRRLFGDLRLRYEFMPIPQLDISSSDIRQRLKAGKPVRYLCPDTVVEYIHENKLYLD